MPSRRRHREARVREQDAHRAGRRPATGPVARADATTRVVARRRHLPGLRRAASPTGTATATGDLAGVRARLPVPARPRRRRDLVHALVRLAARRRRLRRRRLPRDRPAFGTLEEAEALIAEALDARHPHHRRRRPQPRLRPARVVPGGPRRRPRLAGARAVLVPPRQGPGRREPPTRLGLRLRRAAPGRGPRTPTARPASGTCTCSRRSSPTSTGRTPTCAREFEDVLRFWFDRGVAGIRIDSAALLVKDADAARGPGRPGAGRAPARRPRRDPRRLPRAGAQVADSYPATRVAGRRGVAAGPARFAQYLRPGRAAHRVQLRLPGPRRGTPASCASRST